MYIVFFLFLINLIFSNSLNSKSFDDSILYRVTWPGNEKNIKDVDSNTAFEKLEMITSDNEKYHCLIPIEDDSDHKINDIYDGPTAIQLLSPLFKKKICTVRMEAFWTYELCHGQHIIQYHEDPEDTSNRLQEYNLGVVLPEYLSKLETEFEASNKDKKEKNVIQHIIIEGINLPYFEVKYTGGTPCDLTGNSRTTRVLYVCLSEGRHSIFSVKEIYTCDYEIVIITSYLCKHPDYKPKTSPQIDLNCVPSGDADKRPKNLKELELDSLMMRTYGTTFKSDSDSETLRVVRDSKKMENILDFIEEKFKSQLSRQESLESSLDYSILRDFLTGQQCLQGGSGWWKYEVCFTKSVQQYRQEPGTNRYDILLGTFDLEAHKEWLIKNPKKKFTSNKKEISHLYSNGAYCDAISNKRQTEVKLKCKESVSSLALYLLEPTTCKYMLVVESASFCPLLKYVDEWNMLDVSSLNIDKFKKETPKGEKSIFGAKGDRSHLKKLGTGEDETGSGISETFETDGFVIQVDLGDDLSAEEDTINKRDSFLWEDEPMDSDYELSSQQREPLSESPEPDTTLAGSQGESVNIETDLDDFKLESSGQKQHLASSKPDLTTSNIETTDSSFAPVDSNLAPVDSKLEPADSKLEPADLKVGPVEPKSGPVEPKLEPAGPKVGTVDSKLDQTDPKVKQFDSKLRLVDPKLEPADPKLEPSSPDFPSGSKEELSDSSTPSRPSKKRKRDLKEEL